jgi:oleate hydratase
MAEIRTTCQDGTHILIGGGIASLAAAALLLRDARIDGRYIRIIEQCDTLGGSLDASGNAQTGYLIRGGRMFEEHFACTFALFDSIPSIDIPGCSVSADIESFNREVVSRSHCRLVRNGRKAEDRHSLQLSWMDRLAFVRLMLARESDLAGRTIDSWFRQAFFDSNFWLFWSTMFSFEPWHSLVEMRRYMRRFIHLFPGLSTLSGILRTRYNQYDSLILPLQQWLSARGVTFTTGRSVTDVEITGDTQARLVTRICLDDGQEISVKPEDRVYLTLGSMTDSATYGSNHLAPQQQDQPGPSWRLWQRLARVQRGLGRPEVFCGEPANTAWHSFTVTLDRPDFHEFMEQFSGNSSGTGGLVTFADSAWLMSIVMAHQPHFKAQPPSTFVFWGYGLRGDRRGNAVNKSMWEASGEEILSELASQLRLDVRQKTWFEGARVIPCRMPFITSQFMPRVPGDRPPVQPEGAGNFAMMGQFCELDRDCVFTVEYSVRSAWEAVAAMTGKVGPPPPVARTDRDPIVLLRAMRTLLFG